MIKQLRDGRSVDEKCLLKFNVTNQRITREDWNELLEDPDNYVFAEFDFDDSWKGLDVTVNIRYDNNRSEDLFLDRTTDDCQIPSFLLKAPGIKVSCIGNSDAIGNSRSIATDYTDVIVKKRWNEDPEPIADLPITHIKSNSLSIDDSNKNSVTIEIPNDYGTTLQYDSDTGRLTLLWKPTTISTGFEDEHIRQTTDLSHIVLPMITSIDFNAEEDKIIIQTADKPDPTILYLGKYLTEEEAKNKISAENFTAQDKEKLHSLNVMYEEIK